MSEYVTEHIGSIETNFLPDELFHAECSCGWQGVCRTEARQAEDDLTEHHGTNASRTKEDEEA